MKARYSSLLFA